MQSTQERTLMDHGRPEVLQGTLDLMILKALESLGPLHGFGIARRLEQISEGLLRLNEGTVYTALLRLGQRGWIRSTWGVSERNRKARFYSITPAGRRRLAREQKGWRQMAGIMERVMRLAPEE
jgi:PadR family transcriptional regulator